MPTNNKLSIKKSILNFKHNLKSTFYNQLDYLEFHLTDHCNLSCKGCGHYSNIAPKTFTDLAQYKNDIFRLSKIFHNIHKIRILGGEPLLHPEVASFIKATRKAFPYTDIRLVTNGILLSKVSDDFWDICHSTGTIIDLTVYPPFYNQVDYWKGLCEAKGVYLSPSLPTDHFYSHLNTLGNSNKEKAFNICRNIVHCYFLQNGNIYPCPMPALVHYFNDQFNYQIIADKGINIYSSDISAKKIIKYLNTPMDTCKWCSYEFIPFSWGVSKKVIQEWDVDFYKNNPE